MFFFVTPRFAARLWQGGAAARPASLRGDLIYFWRIYFGFSPVKLVLVLQRPRIIIIMTVNPAKTVVSIKGSSSNWKDVNDLCVAPFSGVPNAYPLSRIDSHKFLSCSFLMVGSRPQPLPPPLHVGWVLCFRLFCSFAQRACAVVKLRRGGRDL